MRLVLHSLRGCLLTLFVVSACSGSSTDSRSKGNQGASANGGDAGSASGSGGAGKGGSSSGGSATGGGGTSGGSGSANGGTSGSAGSSESGSGGAAGSAAGGTAGSSAGTAGRSGAAGESAACSRDDDCVIASTYSTGGCCSRGCGVALNADWVANEPCATADPMTDPVPASCNTGCLQCPQDPRCEVVHAAVCVAGACTAVTNDGPCSSDADCLLAIDYESTMGACCSCPRLASRTTLEHDPCIVPVSDPKPEGCEPGPTDVCSTIGCPPMCATPTNLRCNAGRCVGG